MTWVKVMVGNATGCDDTYGDGGLPSDRLHSLGKPPDECLVKGSRL